MTLSNLLTRNTQNLFLQNYPSFLNFYKSLQWKLSMYLFLLPSVHYIHGWGKAGSNADSPTPRLWMWLSSLSPSEYAQQKRTKWRWSPWYFNSILCHSVTSCIYIENYHKWENTLKSITECINNLIKSAGEWLYKTTPSMFPAGWSICQICETCSE